MGGTGLAGLVWAGAGGSLKSEPGGTRNPPLLPLLPLPPLRIRLCASPGGGEGGGGGRGGAGGGEGDGAGSSRTSPAMNCPGPAPELREPYTWPEVASTRPLLKKVTSPDQTIHPSAPPRRCESVTVMAVGSGFRGP